MSCLTQKSQLRKITKDFVIVTSNAYLTSIPYNELLLNSAKYSGVLMRWNTVGVGSYEYQSNIFPENCSDELSKIIEDASDSKPFMHLLSINKFIVGRALSESYDGTASKEILCEMCLKELCEDVPVIHIFESSYMKISKSDIMNDSIGLDELSKSILRSKDNVGWKIMKSMGWEGKGLGVDGTGILWPISAGGQVRCHSKTGISYTSKKDKQILKKNLNKLLQNYRLSNCFPGGLVLYEGFSKAELQYIKSIIWQTHHKDFIEIEREADEEFFLIIIKRKIAHVMLESGNNSSTGYSIYDADSHNLEIL